MIEEEKRDENKEISHDFLISYLVEKSFAPVVALNHVFNCMTQITKISLED